MNRKKIYVFLGENMGCSISKITLCPSQDEKIKKIKKKLCRCGGVVDFFN